MYGGSGKDKDGRESSKKADRKDGTPKKKEKKEKKPKDKDKSKKVWPTSRRCVKNAALWLALHVLMAYAIDTPKECWMLHMPAVVRFTRSVFFFC